MYIQKFTWNLVNRKKENTFDFFQYIILGNSLNGKSKKFVADASDVHVSDEELKSFDDNVNSAKCVSINTTPGKNTNL